MDRNQSNIDIPAADSAAAIVRDFAQLSFHSSDWERLIGDSSVSRHGCLLDAWNIECPIDQREQLKMSGALALRQAYSTYTNSAAAWRQKAWTDGDISKVLCIAFRAVMEELKQPLVVESASDEVHHALNAAAQPSGFVPWRLFRNRHPCPNEPGVYVVAHFSHGPDTVVDLLSENLIYIGLAARQSIAVRLGQFERTALFGLGHTGGWSYRIHFAPTVFNNRYSLLRRFHNTYCSWCTIPDTATDAPRTVERRLLRDYADRWACWPRLNRKG